MQNITIAIDGYSSTGKSTIAKQLAKHLGYIYVDSGAMYRAVTLYAMQNGCITNGKLDSNNLISKLNEIDISFHLNPESQNADVYLNGVNVERKIRTLEVSNHVSQIAAISEVRSILVRQQQMMGEDKGVVMDGRDIGTVVFPNAEIKIFMTASAETRAKRRYNELITRGDKVFYDEVLKNIQQRDFIDTNRDDSPLVKADDAIEIDNSNLTMKEQFQVVLDMVDKKLSK